MTGDLDRSKLQELLARQSRVARPVELPSLGVKAWVRPLGGEEQTRIGAYASAELRRAGVTDAGSVDDDTESDLAARSMVAVVRWAVVDEAGEPICASYAEAAGLLNALDIEDLRALNEVLRPIAEAVGGVEEGKGS